LFKILISTYGILLDSFQFYMCMTLVTMWEIPIPW